jgi:hypothetical protein
VSPREIIEAAGAEYVGRRGNSVRFCDPETGKETSLYLSAISLENVCLALKAAREDLLEFQPWMPAQ